MVASYDTVEEIYKAVRKHVTDEQMEKIITDLLQIQGSRSFRDTIVRLAVIWTECGAAVDARVGKAVV